MLTYLASFLITPETLMRAPGINAHYKYAGAQSNVVRILKTGFILVMIALLVAAPVSASAQEQVGMANNVPSPAGEGYRLGCPGCPGCPDNPVRDPNEPACF